MSKAKIAIYLHDYSLLGGVERVTSNLANLLIENNFNVDTIFSLQQANTVPKIKYKDLLKIEIFNANSTANVSFQKKINNYINLNKITHLIIQVQDLQEANVLIKAIKGTSCKIIPVLHTSPYLYTKWYFPKKGSSLKAFLRFLKMEFYWKPLNISLFKKIMEQTNLFVCVSQAAQKELEKIIATKNISFIHNPLHLVTNNQEKEITKENKILYVGRLSLSKSPIQMVNVWKALSEKHPSWSFTVLGDGEEMQNMQLYIKKHKVKNIELLGSVSNVDDYMLKSKISVLLSYYEGLPTSLLEASYFSNALVAYDGDGGISDIVKHEQNGFIHKVGDDKEVEKSLDKLMTDQVLLSKMMLASKKNLEKFSNTNILKSWHKLLK